MSAKTALVTGSSRGIGRAIALELAEKGYDLCVNYLSSGPEAQAVCQDIRVMGRKAICVQADVANIADLERMFSQMQAAFGRIDVLVNNAGITEYLPLLTCTESLWDRITKTNWKAAYFATQFAAKLMVAQGEGGVIINITSIHQRCNFPMANVYGPAKAALTKFTEHAALELAPHGIRVVALAPGCTLVHDGEDESPRGRQLKERIPMGRYATVREVAKAAAWLASDEAAYITGSSLLMDGGCVLPSHLDSPYIPGIQTASGKSL